MAKKQKKKWNLKKKIASAIRKIWRTSPLKAKALELACTNPEAIVREKLYRCAECQGEFLAQQVDVNHKKDAEKQELVNSFINRIFCGIDVVTYDEQGKEITWYAGHETSLEEVVMRHLDVMCIRCHKALTKQQNAERRRKK